MNQLIRLANGQLGILLQEKDTEYKFSVPQADAPNLEISLSKKDVDISKPLWSEKVPYRKLSD